MMLLFAVQPFVDKGAIALILGAIIAGSDHAANMIHVYTAASRITLPNFRRGGSSIKQLMCDEQTLPLSKFSLPLKFSLISTNGGYG